MPRPRLALPATSITRAVPALFAGALLALLCAAPAGAFQGPWALATYLAGIALFCVTGALKALDYGLGPVPAALMGMLTGIGGGMLRDLLASRVPVIFSSELYATPALAGAAWAVLAHEQGWSLAVVALPGMVVCFGWRVLAIMRNWRAPIAKGPASV